MAYVLLCLKCHTHTFSQVSAKLEHFEKFDFWTPLWSLNDSTITIAYAYNMFEILTRIIFKSNIELNTNILRLCPI